LELEDTILNYLKWNINQITAYDILLYIFKELYPKISINDLKEGDCQNSEINCFQMGLNLINFIFSEFCIYKKYNEFIIMVSCILYVFNFKEEFFKMNILKNSIEEDLNLIQSCLFEINLEINKEEIENEFSKFSIKKYHREIINILFHDDEILENILKPKTLNFSCLGNINQFNNSSNNKENNKDNIKVYSPEKKNNIISSPYSRQIPIREVFILKTPKIHFTPDNKFVKNSKQLNFQSNSNHVIEKKDIEFKSNENQEIKFLNSTPNKDTGLITNIEKKNLQLKEIYELKGYDSNLLKNNDRSDSNNTTATRENFQIDCVNLPNKNLFAKENFNLDLYEDEYNNTKSPNNINNCIEYESISSLETINYSNKNYKDKFLFIKSKRMKNLNNYTEFNTIEKTNRESQVIPDFLNPKKK